MEGEAGAEGQTAAGEVEEARPFHVERRGLLPIPPDERRGDPRELFWTWVGGAFNYVTIAAGALPVLFGLSLPRALAAVVIGNVIGAVVFGLCARHGPRTATATIVNTRAALGYRGNLPAALVSFVAVAGWVAVNTALAVFAAAQISAALGVALGPTAKALLTAALLAGQMVIALYGHATIMAAERVFAIGSGAVLVGALAFVLPRLDWAAPPAAPLAAGTPAATLLMAASAMFAMPLAWSNYAADYARYLPERTDARRVALYSGLGIGVANLVGCAIGALFAAVVDMRDPLASMPGVLPRWYLLPFMAAVLWGAVANNVLNLYTAGLGMLALGARARRSVAVLVVALGAAVPTYAAVFVYRFMDLFAQFLSLSLVFLSPWAAILLVDFRLRRGRYDAEALHTPGRGPYWYTGGVCWPALVSYLVAVAAALACASSTLWSGPVSAALLGGADLSAFVGFGTAALLLRVLAGPALLRSARAAGGAS